MLTDELTNEQLKYAPRTLAPSERIKFARFAAYLKSEASLVKVETPRGFPASNDYEAADPGLGFCWDCADALLQQARQGLQLAIWGAALSAPRLALLLWTLCDERQWWETERFVVTPQLWYSPTEDDYLSCTGCNVLLEHALTDDGVSTVLEAFAPGDGCLLTPRDCYILSRVVHGIMAADGELDALLPDLLAVIDYYKPEYDL